MPLFIKDKIQLKRPFFLLLGFTLYPLLIFFGVAGYFLEQHNFQKNVLAELKNVERLFDHQSTLHVSELQTLISHYSKNPLLQKAFLSQSREELYKIAQPFFRTALDQGISHFYFINPDKTCFLRVHNPERHGDLIERFTTQEAGRTGRLSTGLEMGTYGTFTLRAVQPWYTDGKLIGYIELGRDINSLSSHLKDIIDTDLFILINKRHLDRPKWQEGLWMTGKTGNWDELEKYIIFDRTIRKFPKEFTEYLKLPDDAKKNQLIRVSIDGRNYRGGFIPLRDARGNKLGEIIALRDCKDEFSFRILSILFVVGSAGVGILIFALFYAYTNSLEGRLQLTYSELRTEIKFRKDAEKKLHKNEEELELLVHERTTRLEQANLQLQREVKERLKITEELLKAQRLESIGILAGGIAHDFNKLLMTILDKVNLAAMDKDLSVDGKNLLQDAEKASLQAQTLTQQLITFSDTERLSSTVVNLGELASQVVTSLLPNTVTCSYDIPPDLWHVLVDKNQLVQVITILIDNARTAMDDQGMIEISCANQDYSTHRDLSLPARKFVTLAIKDSGCGIPEENLSKIFDPYFRTPAGNNNEGSGMGLSIAHAIITKHQGFIRIKSQVHIGSTFTVYLPAHNTGEEA